MAWAKPPRRKGITGYDHQAWLALPESLAAWKDSTLQRVKLKKLNTMIIASSWNPAWLIIVGLIMLIAGIYWLGWAVRKICEDPDEWNDSGYYEEYTASDGKKYWWPVNHPRSSKTKKTDDNGTN